MVVDVARWFSYIISQSPAEADQPSSSHTSNEDPPSPVKGELVPTQIFPQQTLTDAKYDAKALEWKKTLETMIEAFGSDEYKASEEKPPKYYIKLRLERLLAKKVTDQFINQLIENAHSIPEIITHLENQGLKRAVSQHAEELYTDLETCRQTPFALRQVYSQFKSKFHSFATLISASREYVDYDPESYAKAIWSAFGELIQHPAYLLMRCDDNHIIVGRLHNFALGSQAYCESSDAIHNLGAAIQTAAKIKRTASLQDMLLTSRTTAAEAGFLVNDLPEKSLTTSVIKVTRILRDFFKLVRAQIAPMRTLKVIGRQIYEQFFASIRNYRIYAENLPSVGYHESFSSDANSSVNMRILLHASPTEGATVLPEFRAMLQAVENRRNDNPKNDRYPTRAIIYTNLQNRFAGNEALQTKALMRLNDRYPTAFHGITVSSEDLDDLTFDDTLPEKLRDIILSEQSFTLEKTTGKSNYYFPPTEKEKWQDVLPPILKNAYTVIKEDTRVPDKEKLESFYQLVNSCIIRFREVEAATTQFEKGSTREIVVIRSCAVCTDRGPHEHSKQLLLTGSKLDAIARLQIANGPLRKGRLPIEKKVKETARFSTKWSERAAIKAFFVSIASDLIKTKHITTSTLTSPVLKSATLRDPEESRLTKDVRPKKLF